MNYFVVMLNYPARYCDGVRISIGGQEAIVNPEVTRREVVSRIKSGEYERDMIVFIHHVRMNELPDDVTEELLCEANDVLPPSNIRPVKIVERV